MFAPGKFCLNVIIQDDLDNDLENDLENDLDNDLGDINSLTIKSGIVHTETSFIIDRH